MDGELLYNSFQLWDVIVIVRGGLVVSALNSGSSGPGSSPGQDT